jgi:hypothetical protein
VISRGPTKTLLGGSDTTIYRPDRRSPVISVFLRGPTTAFISTADRKTKKHKNSIVMRFNAITILFGKCGKQHVEDFLADGKMGPRELDRPSSLI